MTTVVTTKKEGRIGRPLKILVPLIKEELEAGDSAGLEHYRRAGEMLLEARNQVEQYRWGTWLSQNFELSRVTATRYMRLAERIRENPDVSRKDTSLHAALGYADPNQNRAAWRKVAASAREINRELFGQERQTRDDEVRLHREMAEELIDAGYRVLATRLHPDKGGSTAAMKRLNRVREDLKSLAKQRRFV